MQKQTSRLISVHGITRGRRRRPFHANGRRVARPRRQVVGFLNADVFGAIRRRQLPTLLVRGAVEVPAVEPLVAQPAVRVVPFFGQPCPGLRSRLDRVKVLRTQVRRPPGWTSTCRMQTRAAASGSRKAEAACRAVHKHTGRFNGRRRRASAFGAASCTKSLRR